MYEEIINNRELHERIADNINQTIASSTPGNGLAALGDNEPTTLTAIKPTIGLTPDLHMPDSLIKNIVNKTGSDPVFESLLNQLFSKVHTSYFSYEIF